ncbi:MAG TPA: CDP-alcohol phosphatidyltransferase family protein [Bacteroidales bacterium]|nr:CDP-alcohol phosphatidyltransferase family protein [Bacteroidales bacterium]
MKTIRFIIPNLITSFNLVFGIAAIIAALGSDFTLAFWFILCASVCDFADGLLARLLNAYSDFGKHLDSLSDLVSFGLAPSFMVFVFMQNATGDVLPNWLTYNAFSLCLFSAYRLARFNTQSSSSDFLGLAVPAAALYMASLVAYGKDLPWHFGIMTQDLVMLHLHILVINVLMISNLKMFSLKFKNLILGENRLRYLFIAGSLILLLVFGVAGLWFVMVFYIILSAAWAVFFNKKEKTL